MKPKHQGGYSERHVVLCERTLVTLLRGLGPWKHGVYLVGGLVPRYLLGEPPTGVQPHAGTTDIDLVLDLAFLADVQAYQRLEENLKNLGFERGRNDDGRAQHFSWRKSVGAGVTVVVDLLCEVRIAAKGGQPIDLPGERRLSALHIPGAHLVTTDFIDHRVTAELLDDRGVATEHIRVGNIVPFLVLKALAYEDRSEEKDAYDLIYCLENYRAGPIDIASAFVDSRRRADEPLLSTFLDILRNRFASDERTSGARKDGPTAYARFLTDPGQPEQNALRRQQASAVVERLLEEIARLERNDKSL